MTFTAHTPEAHIAGFVDEVRRAGNCGEALSALLPETHPLYRGRSTNETARIRGYVLAAFEQTGLPEAGMPYVLEELESGREPYLVAAAAKAARGAHPAPELAAYLSRAVENIALHDDVVTFERYRPDWPLPAQTTALTEIFRTFGWLGAAARHVLETLQAWQSDHRFSAAIRAEIAVAIERIRHGTGDVDAGCCGAAASTFSLPVRHQDASDAGVRAEAASTSAIVFEDQDGALLRFDDWRRGQPAIVVFFYTRCDNPNKCSLTISKLARLQDELAQRGLGSRVRTLAITYDPEYDIPIRLHQYGHNRDVRFGPDHRFVRTREGAAELQAFFNPGVNFGPVTVNRHRIDLFVLDAHGNIAVNFERAQWTVEHVLNEAVALVRPDPRDQPTVQAPQ